MWRLRGYTCLISHKNCRIMTQSRQSAEGFHFLSFYYTFSMEWAWDTLIGMYLYKEKDALSLKVGQEWSSQLQFGLSQACRHNLRPTPFCWYIRHSTIKVQYMNIDLASCNSLHVCDFTVCGGGTLWRYSWWLDDYRFGQYQHMPYLDWQHV